MIHVRFEIQELSGKSSFYKNDLAVVATILSVKLGI